MAMSCLRALPRVTRTCAPCLAARGVAFSDESHAPRELAAILPEYLQHRGRRVTASDGLVACRGRITARVGARSGGSSYNHRHDKQSLHHIRWPVLADRSHLQRQ